jgi:hypothetical protein
MDFDFAGPSKKPYLKTTEATPRLPYVKAVDPAAGANCANCLKTALGCGSNPTEEGLKRCQRAQEAIQSVLSQDCVLNARTFSSFPAKVAEQCSSLCSLNRSLEYGAGYTRPYNNANMLAF